MQRCHFCESEFPDNARFCGTCGRAPTSSMALNTAAPSFASSPEESVYTIATIQLPQGNQSAKEDEEERRRGAILPLPIPFGTEGSLAGGQVPLVQSTPSFGSVPTVQGTPTGMAGSLPSNMAGPAPSAPYVAPSAGQPAGFVPQSPPWASQPTPHSAHPTGMQSHVSPEQEHPGKQRHHHREHRQHHVHRSAHETGAAARSATGGITKVILIVTIGVVVVAVGASALVFALRSHLPSLAGIIPATSSNSSTISSNPNINATACAVSPGIPCVGTTSLSSPVASGKSTGTFNFSGAVSGVMVITSFPACGVTQGNTYVMQVIGTVGGTQYKFLIGILSYKGPGIFTSKLTVDLIRGTGANSNALANDGRFPVSISITNGGKTGTVSSDLEGILNGFQLSQGHVSANWTCG